MGKFEAGHDPADHTVAEVNEFLKGEDVTGDEYDRVVQAEREGRNRVGIISGSGVEEQLPDAPPADDTAADDLKSDTEDVSGDGTGGALPPADPEPAPEPANPLQMQPAERQKTQTPAEALALAVERAKLIGRPTATVDE